MRNDVIEPGQGRTEEQMEFSYAVTFVTLILFVVGVFGALVWSWIS